MCHNAASVEFQEAYLPTMPQDDLDEVKAAILVTTGAGENPTFFRKSKPSLHLRIFLASDHSDVLDFVVRKGIRP
jgi:hypothetical protein